MSVLNIDAALAAVEADLNKAWRALGTLQSPDVMGYEEYLEEQIDSGVERAFITLLLLCELLSLTSFRLLVQEEFEKARAQEGGFGGTITDPNGDLYLLAGRHVSKFLKAFRAAYGLGKGFESTTVIDVLDVLRNCEYSLILSQGMDAPSDESELHERIETILRCVYPDLKHKPSISKPIKNFEPDTGLPSIKTLIEYKYVGSQADLKRVADEILADTQGYRSRDWSRFVYLIYETRRFQSEKKWVMHLVECGNPRNTDVVVIRGELPQNKPPRTKQKRPVRSKGASR